MVFSLCGMSLCVGGAGVPQISDKLQKAAVKKKAPYTPSPARAGAHKSGERLLRAASTAE